MPVTARLSQGFYEKFGDDIVNELVGLLNQVDAVYRSELRDVNELNFARFDAKLELRIAEVNARIDSLGAELRAEIRALRAELLGAQSSFQGSMQASMQASVQGLQTDMQALKAEMIKWMFLFWAGTALGGLLLR